MALEATHIRFALDLKGEYKIKDLGKYIQGTIYPDSRYVTGIDRNLTHNEEILSPQFAKDDFRKGWQVHQICDLVGREAMKKHLSKIVNQTSDGFIAEEWIAASAIKIIQDMNDLKYFDLQIYLKYFEDGYNPNGEKIEDIKKFNRTMIELYKNTKEISVSDYYMMWLSLGVNEEFGKNIKEKTEEYLRDKELVEKIEGMYDKMMEKYKKKFI